MFKFITSLIMMMLLFRNTRTIFTFTLTTSFLCVSGVGVRDSFKVAT